MSNILENFYGVLFTPEKTFSEIKENPPLLHGFIIVILVSIISPLVNFEISNIVISFLGLIFSMIGAAFWGTVSWLFWGSFIEIIASVFKQSGKLKEFLTLSAFALIPWFFAAPLSMLKIGGIIGAFIGVTLSLVVWLWVTILSILAIMKAYNLSLGKVITLLIVPFFGGFIAFSWFIGFWSTLFDILHTT